jgi:hypothetical protein
VEEEEAGLIGVLLRTGVEAVAVDVDVAVAVEEEGGWRVRLVLGGVDMLRTFTGVCPPPPLAVAAPLRGDGRVGVMARGEEWECCCSGGVTSGPVAER